MAKTISGTHCTYPRRDGQAEWAWVAWIHTRMIDLPKVITSPSTNWARCSLTSLLWQTLLPLRQTSHLILCFSCFHSVVAVFFFSFLACTTASAKCQRQTSVSAGWPLLSHSGKGYCWIDFNHIIRGRPNGLQVSSSCGATAEAVKNFCICFVWHSCSDLKLRDTAVRLWPADGVVLVCVLLRNSRKSVKAFLKCR